MGALLAGVYLTQSRGTFLAGGVAVLVWVLLSGPTVRRRGAAMLPLLLPLSLLPGVGDRMVALLRDLTSGAVTYGIDPSVLGRTAAQQIAWAMFRDRPVFGFGPGTYTSLVPEYAGVVQTAVLEPTDAPHNLYAQFAAESGLLGLLCWLIMFGGLTAVSAVAVARIGRHRPDDRILAAAVFAALVAYAVASIFLHLAYLRSIGILLALAVVVFSSSGPALPAPVSRQLRRRVTVVGLTIAASVAGALVVLDTVGPPETLARQRITTLSTLPVSGNQAYALDIRSRDSFLPTLATVMAQGAPPGSSVVADPVRGVITVSATGSDEQEARQSLGAALADGRRRLDEVGAANGYTLRPLGRIEVDRHRRRSPAAVGAALATGALIAGAAAVLFRPRRRRRPEDGSPSSSPEQVGATR